MLGLGAAIATVAAAAAMAVVMTMMEVAIAVVADGMTPAAAALTSALIMARELVLIPLITKSAVIMTAILV